MSSIEIPTQRRTWAFFFSLEGVDGCGKSTQVALLAEFLRQRGHSITICRDPGCTPIGEKLRGLLLSREENICMTTETLLYMASRAQMVREIIQPALACGNVVLSDRYLLSTLAYQGYAGGVALEAIRQIGEFATDGCYPVWTGVLDLEIETAQHRRQRTPDRLESRQREYHEKVRAGFLQEAKLAPQRITVVDASASIDKVQAIIREEVCRVLDTSRGS